ncbi:MAG: pyridoxal 5'-phosphate synthase glutaminase subunit PdxT [Actinobacteria bacterium]|nr:pyridoxal 5'-phosphate synthase glutaminase subunit PdxT [Actinomycetota bacterium]
MKVGILGLQGDVREHARLIDAAGATAIIIKHAAGLDEVAGLIVPGGESTTIGKLLDRFGILDPLRERIRAGMPVYGTCAGAILMAREVRGPEGVPHSIGVMDMAIVRNAYGRQVDSFETDLDVAGLDRPLRSVFIRAPIIEEVGSGVEVLAEFDDRPVLVRENGMLASTFHPEIAGDERVHRIFLDLIEEAG